MKILSVSDQIDPRIYSDKLKERHSDVAFVLSCGDLPNEYLEFIISGLNQPLYFIHGNHDRFKYVEQDQSQTHPFGADNLHGKIYREQGLLLAGVEGCILYNRKTKYQYTLWKALPTSKLACQIKFPVVSERIMSRCR